MKSGQGVRATFEQIAAAAAYITKNGGGAEENFTALDNLFNQLGRRDTASNAKALGVNLFDAKGQRRDFMQMIGEIKVAMDKLPNEEKQMQFLDVLFGGGGDIRALRGFRTVINNYEEMNKAAERYKNTVGVTEKAYAKFQASTGYNAKIILNKVKVFGLESAEAMNPYLNALATGEKDMTKIGAAWNQSVDNLSKVSPVLGGLAHFVGWVGWLFAGKDMDDSIRNLKRLAITLAVVYGTVKALQVIKWWSEWKMAKNLGGAGGMLGGTTGIMNVSAGVVNINSAIGGALPGGPVPVPPVPGGGGAGAFIANAIKGAAIPAAALVIRDLMEQSGESQKDFYRHAGIRQVEDDARRMNVLSVGGTKNIAQRELDRRNTLAARGWMSAGTQQNNIVVRQDQPIILNGIQIGNATGAFSKDFKFPEASPGKSSETIITVPVGEGN
jgi:hypothetical protein